jgi:hypothetical protein
MHGGADGSGAPRGSKNGNYKHGRYGANRTSGLGMITALSLLEQGFRDLASPVAVMRAGGFFENFLYGLDVAQGGTLPVYYNPTNRK